VLVSTPNDSQIGRTHRFVYELSVKRTPFQRRQDIPDNIAPFDEDLMSNLFTFGADAGKKAITTAASVCR
jgi:hypothetical protein